MSEIKNLICVKHGGSPIGLNNFYMALSGSMYSGIGYIPVCKSCIDKIYNEYLKKYKEEKLAIYNMCRLLDLPFTYSSYEGAIAHSEKSNWKLYQSFFKHINSLGEFNSSTTCFADSESLDIEQNEVEQYGDSDTSYPKQIWGDGLEGWEYEFLDNEIHMLKTDFECSDYGMEMIMKDIAFINLDIHKARYKNNNNSKTIKDLIKMRSDLMNDGNLKPIQATGADKNEKVSLGVFIKKWENERPIDQGMDDEMKRYIDTYMVGHLATMQGMNNEFVDYYKDATENYTIDFKDLYSGEDSDE